MADPTVDQRPMPEVISLLSSPSASDDGHEVEAAQPNANNVPMRPAESATPAAADDLWAVDDVFPDIFFPLDVLGDVATPANDHHPVRHEPEASASPDPRPADSAATLDEAPPRDTALVGPGQYVMIDDEQVFIPADPLFPHFGDADDEECAALATADGCLARVLSIFPNVCHEHVLKLHETFEQMLPAARFQSILDRLADEEYPKQKHDASRKRKSDGDSDQPNPKRWMAADRAPLSPGAKNLGGRMLKAEFPTAPIAYIAVQLDLHRHFYPTYVSIAASLAAGGSWRGRRSLTSPDDAEGIAAGSKLDEASVLVGELKAAREQVHHTRMQRKEEEDNWEQAKEMGTIVECSACFDDMPQNRQISCDGRVPHWTCYTCMKTYLKTRIGDSDCRLDCPAGCGAGFKQRQLSLLGEDQLVEKFAQLQQEKDIRDAGLEGLEDCPFCDYKAILPPIEENFEFHCANPECAKVSCRRCKAVSHTPLTCEEAGKDKKLNMRHTIEEAMTAALVRTCNKCKKQFIKESGCNKMTCPNCSNLQCYVCSESVKDYTHFDQTGPGGTRRANATKCPLYDNVEERHEREVKEAEAAARQQALQEGGQVSEADLEIRMSDAVNQDTAARVIRHRVHANGGPAFVEDDLVPRRIHFRELDHEGLGQEAARRVARRFQDRLAHRRAQPVPPPVVDDRPRDHGQVPQRDVPNILRPNPHWIGYLGEHPLPPRPPPPPVPAPLNAGTIQWQPQPQNVIRPHVPGGRQAPDEAALAEWDLLAADVEARGMAPRGWAQADVQEEEAVRRQRRMEELRTRQRRAHQDRAVQPRIAPWELGLRPAPRAAPVLRTPPPPPPREEPLVPEADLWWHNLPAPQPPAAVSAVAPNQRYVDGMGALDLGHAQGLFGPPVHHYLLAEAVPLPQPLDVPPVHQANNFRVPHFFDPAAHAALENFDARGEQLFGGGNGEAELFGGPWAQ